MIKKGGAGCYKVSSNQVNVNARAKMSEKIPTGLFSGKFHFKKTPRRNKVVCMYCSDELKCYLKANHVFAPAAGKNVALTTSGGCQKMLAKCTRGMLSTNVPQIS